MQVLLYVLLVAFVFVAASVLLAGVGLLVRRVFGLRRLDAEAVLMAPWIGWCLAIVLLQLWHLVLPADGRALGLVCAIGAAGLILNAQDLARWGRGAVRSGWGFAVMALIAAVWLANQTTTQARHYDTGLYHLMSAKWAHEYPIVPGLGNLRNILAYNSSYFLYVAMLDVGPFVHRAHHLASGFLLYPLLVRALLSSWQLFVRKASAEAWRVFDCLVLVPAVVYAMSEYGSSPSPDVGVWVLSLLVASELLKLMAHGEAAGGAGNESPPGDPREAGYAVFGIVAMSAIGVTAKLSFVAFSAVASALALRTAFRFPRLRAALGARLWAWILIGGCLVMVPWLARGVVVSGYPAYPSTVCGFPVEWRMPEYMAQRNVSSLYAWGRLPEESVEPEQVLSNWRWLWLWTNRMSRQSLTVMMPLFLALVAAPLLLTLCRTKDERARQPAFSWLFLLAPLASLALWLVTSPQPRFVEGSFWALGLGALALALRRMAPDKVCAVLVCVTVLLFSLSVEPFAFVRQWHKDIGPVRKGDIEAVQTESGLTVYVPRHGDQCWDAPLPSTTHRAQLNPKLRLRVPGDLSRGFVIDRATGK